VNRITNAEIGNELSGAGAASTHTQKSDRMSLQGREEIFEPHMAKDGYRVNPVI